ncbi:peptide/nickel transport system substrate-binding protein [Salinihabitans flavidus]|uniref:Peptide/nickel transport system substrate-binding protein n=1 Tax=Salinihabitans flavidus TaxID=569882 RepID=A0A1H8S3A5_9RHOB|nr:ABC transporter substrate-binding protein [Salinihabitans flavidus]SEO73072.1 peptide/nickel transport system substrate-binding protein [Salinihabitans flavidus]
MAKLIKPHTGGLTRRRFMSTTAATGAAAALGASVWGGRAQAQQKRGGTLRVAKGHGQTTDTLNPGTYENGYMLALSYGIHGFLTGVGRDGSIEPELAESWEASPDAKTWRFKLRSGVTFHSGKTLTAEDVVASINFHRGEDSTSAAKPLLSSIIDISADGDTVVFTLDAGSADFPFTFTDYHLAILPVKDGEVDWRSGDGCGPYKLVNFQPGVSTSFARNTDDWNQNRGWFDEVEMLAIVDLNARTTALISGDVHAIDKLDLKTVGLMERNQNLSIRSVAGNQHYTFAMSCNKDPFTDVNVRLALKHAINREELVEKILFGYGSVGNDHPIGRGQRFYNDEMPQTTYDPDKARHYLKKAGMDGLSVEVAAADAAFPGAVDAAVLYQNAAKEAGIDMKVARKPNDGYWSDVWMKHPFSAVYWGGRAVEDAMFTTAYRSGAAWNDTFWENERFDELLVKARAELDEAKRREMYYEMQLIVNQDGGAVIPMFANYVFATNEDLVTGDTFSSHWDMDGERWMERWSFA